MTAIDAEGEGYVGGETGVDRENSLSGETGVDGGTGVGGESDIDVEEGMSFEVVFNDEEQYSIWPTDRPPPAGWHTIGVKGSKSYCLDHIETVWTDMRPKSLRERR